MNDNYSQVSKLIFLRMAIENAISAGADMKNHLLDMQELESARGLAKTLIAELMETAIHSNPVTEFEGKIPKRIHGIKLGANWKKKSLLTVYQKEQILKKAEMGGEEK